MNNREMKLRNKGRRSLLLLDAASFNIYFVFATSLSKLIHFFINFINLVKFFITTVFHFLYFFNSLVDAGGVVKRKSEILLGV